MAVPTARDASATADALGRFLTHELGLAAISVDILPSSMGTGFSSESVIFDAMVTSADGATDQLQCVARIEPTGYGLYQAFDLESQWRVIDTLWHLGSVPVPRIIAHDTTDGEWLGRPSFVMERVDGVAPADSPPYTVRGWMVDALPAQRRQVYERGLDVLAEVHRADWRRLGLEFLLDSTINPVGVERQHEHDERFLRWIAQGRELPLCEQASAWLRAHLPDDDEQALSWGDARLGNMLFRDFEPVAVLDWEMVTVSPRGADLGWWLVFHMIHTIGIGRPSLDGIPTDDEAVAHYTRVSGHSVRDLHFYEVRAALRAALLLIRYGDHLVSTGVLAADAPRTPSTPALVVLERLLDQG
ncbi:MAG: phosphotransferase family protein [Ilumatobacteraceae bacterium]